MHPDLRHTWDSEAQPCGNEGIERQFVPSPPLPVLASPVSVKLPIYVGKPSGTQFIVISDANGRIGEVKACQLSASLRGEATEIPTLPDTERLKFSSHYNSLYLRFG
ncbi:hypothetical protein TNCV_468491 [Trichonephila clavipes]|nr:hypothetical protein TNCV_468491 [Trichonephila clavipes]